MPLRDHFRPPLEQRRHWEGVHAQWPAMIVQTLVRRLPHRYFAEPRVHLGTTAEIDVGTFDEEEFLTLGNGVGEEEQGGGVATAVWAPPRPTLSLETDLPAEALYEVRIYDEKQGRRLVAAIEICSPANKDRPEHRRAFVAKCAALLQNRVSVVMIDLVTTRHFNLYHDLLKLIGHEAASPNPEPPPIYAVACRGTKKDKQWRLEIWEQPLTLGQLLPTLPLWLADNLAIPLELEGSYEETCRALRIL